MRISDWSSDVCSSDLCEIKLKIASYVDLPFKIGRNDGLERVLQEPSLGDKQYRPDKNDQRQQACNNSEWPTIIPFPMMRLFLASRILRSEEHTSELQSLMRISYAVFCLKKKKNKNTLHN